VNRQAATGTLADPLPSWREGPTKGAILAFVAKVTGEDGSRPVPVEARDGTLWTEKPMPIQLDFILRRLVEMATADPALRERQPWKAAFTKDFGWFGTVMAQHYAGDDSQLPALAGGILAAFKGMTVEEFDQRSDAFLRSATHPTLGRGYLGCAFVPMVELLDYLAANGFTSYIASLYGISRDRVIGSSPRFAWVPDERGGTITHAAAPDYLDDGPEKPIRIWSRTGRRPILAAGNSNGDIPMLQYALHADLPSLRLLVLHDDKEREFDYIGGAEDALKLANADDWTVVSVLNDWASVFPE
jgi:hypothetical protein